MHATAIVVGTRGILITGPSGSGKTTLALTLLANALAEMRHAALVGDDQVLIEAVNGKLIVRGPATIAGLAEVYGLGPRAVPFRICGIMDIVVRLGLPHLAPRLQEPGKVNIRGVILPVLDLPERQTRQTLLALTAWLGRLPFVQ